ncbi:MAG: DUF885 family protein [Blastocatellia bacterium]
MDNSDSLSALAADFWQWRARYQPTSSDDIPRLDRPADWNPDWSQEAVARQRADLAAFEARWQAIDASVWPVASQVDYRLIGSALMRVRWELDVLQGWQRNPRFYIYQTLGALLEELLINRPFDQPRSERVIECLRRFPRLLSDGMNNLAQTAVKPFTLATLEILKDARPRMLTVARELRPLLAADCAAQLDDATETAIAALESFRAWLEQHLPAMSEEAAIGREAYQWFLSQVALMPYTPEQLLAMGRQEWERAMTFEAIAAERAQAAPALPLFADQAAQVASEAEAEQRIRDFLDAHNILTVPAWMQHYLNVPMPAYLEPLIALGVPDDLTGPHRLDENGVRYIPSPAPELGYFELSSARDPRPLIVHEGVPGHYFQMTLAWAHENPIRRCYYDSGPIEGIGFYAEEMMLQAGLFDDSPRTREIIYSFMRLRALRVEVDVKLALGLFTIDEATEYLRTRTPMDYETARFEAVFFASLPGQAITYQIGKIQIVKFLAEARQMLGDKFSLRDFNDYLWKNGNVPVSLLRWEYVGLNDEVTMPAAQ